MKDKTNKCVTFILCGTLVFILVSFFFIIQRQFQVTMILFCCCFFCFVYLFYKLAFSIEALFVSYTRCFTNSIQSAGTGSDRQSPEQVIQLFW